MNITPSRAVVYTRVSTEEQAEEGTSLASQRDQCLLFAKGRSMVVVDTHADEGVSGALYEQRPQLQRAVEAIEQGRARVLIVAKIDRLGRKSRIVLDVAERIDRAGGQLVSCDGMEYGNSPTGKLMLAQLAAFAEFERDTIRERTSNGRRRRAKDGIQPSRSRSPYGFHVVTKQDVVKGIYPPGSEGTYQVVEQQAQWVSEIYSRYAGGMSLNAICRWLNQSGVDTPRGGDYWRESTIKRIIENPAYKGMAAYGRLTTIHDESRVRQGFKETFIRRRTSEDSWTYLRCPAITDEGTWTVCQHRMRTAQQEFSGSRTRRHLLSGLLHCPTCHRKMGATRRERRIGDRLKEEYTYACRDDRPSRNTGGRVCNSTRYDAHEVHGIVTQAVRMAAHCPELFEAAVLGYQRAEASEVALDDRDRLEVELSDLDAKERKTIEAQIAGMQIGASADPYLAILGDIADRRRALSAKLRLFDERQRKDNHIDPCDLAAQVTAILADVDLALSADNICDGEKHDLLARVVERIYPCEEGYLMKLKPFYWNNRKNGTLANMLLVGSPGSGKTMLARRLPTILPPLTVEESLEVTKLYSVAGLLSSHGAALVTQRPFRAPHHTISNAGLTGGGTIPRPGEVSLAHHGVLFLDEFPEFNRDVLEVLRQPLEDGHVTIARAAAALTYPARFTLVAAMNPCPCGFYGDAARACTCSQTAVHKYLQKISGPLLDRIDLHIEVPRLKHDELTAPPAGEHSAAIRERVVSARERQRERFAADNSSPEAPTGSAAAPHARTYCNSQMTSRQIQQHCKIEGDAKTLLTAAINQMNLSARAYDRILKVARTIADLAGEEKIGIAQIAEAVQYRALDRKLWG